MIVIIIIIIYVIDITNTKMKWYIPHKYCIIYKNIASIAKSTICTSRVRANTVQCNKRDLSQDSKCIEFKY